MINISLNVSTANYILTEAEDLDFALNYCLALLGGNLSASRSYIYTIKNESIDETYLWINPNLKEVNENIPPLNYINKSIREVLTPLSKGFHFVGNTNEIKEQFFKHLMTQRKVETFLFIPIFDNYILWGFLGFEHCSIVQWNSEIIKSIELFAKNVSIKINEIRYKKNIGPSFDIFRYYDNGVLEGFWELDLLLREVKLSNNWAKILGFSIYEVEQTYDFLRYRFHSDDLLQIERKFQRFILGEIDQYSGITRMMHKNGNYVWVKYSGTIERNLKGDPVKIIGTIVDVNEFEINKMALEESEKKMRFILENSSDLITQRDINGRYLYISESSKEILGYTPQEIIELNSSYELFHPDSVESVLMEQSNFIKDENRINQIFNVQIRRKDGEYIWMEVLSKKIIVNNTLICIQSTARDIGLRKKLEIQNQKAIARANELNNLKTKLIEMASHQFKTPLTVIYSNAELIEMKSISLEKELAENFKIISSRIKIEIERLTELIENILIFGKYNANQKFNLKIEVVDFNLFFRDLIVNYFCTDAGDRKVDFFSVGQARLFESDTSLLIHIFSNLLNNAFRYSRGKQNPVVKISYLEKKIQVEVIDYGIGIPEQDVKNLYKSFFRASNTTTILGSGLGLTIVKQYTRMLKGKIKLKTKENSGTTIRITFPYEQK